MERRIDGSTLARFSAALSRLLPGGKLGLAVSGGSDSMALLALAHASGTAIEVATVDHGLRKAAAEECRLVKHECERLGVPCQILKANVEQGNLQDRARAARYAALGRWAQDRALGGIATAHHANDQAETLLMRLNRASGIGGLAGIRSSTMIDGCPVPVLRPLLGFSREELRSIVMALEIKFIEDPSNSDEAFDRVRIRHALSNVDWIDPLALANSAGHLETADLTLQAIAEHYWATEADVSQDRIVVPLTQWPELTARLVAMAVRRYGGEVTNGEVSAFLALGHVRANLAGVLIDRRDQHFVCTPEPTRRTGPSAIR